MPGRLPNCSGDLDRGESRHESHDDQFPQSLRQVAGSLSDKPNLGLGQAGVRRVSGDGFQIHRLGGLTIHRRLVPETPSDGVRALLMRDPVQPAHEPGRVLQGVQLRIGLQEALLSDILRLGGIADSAQRHREDDPPVPLHQDAERGDVAAERREHQPFIVSRKLPWLISHRSLSKEESNAILPYRTRIRQKRYRHRGEGVGFGSSKWEVPSQTQNSNAAGIRWRIRPSA